MKFNIDSNFVVTKDTIKVLRLKCNLDDDITAEQTIKFIEVDNSVKAEGETTEKDLDVNLTGTSEVTAKKATLKPAIKYDNSPKEQLVKTGTDDVVLGILELEADHGEITIDDIEVSVSNEIIDGNIEVWVDGKREGVASISDKTATFTNINVDIQDGQKENFTFKSDMDSSPEGHTTLTVTHIKLESDETKQDITDVVFEKITTKDAVPVVTPINVDTSNLGTVTNEVLFKYSVKADGGDIKLGNTVFEMTATGVNFANAKVLVYDNTDRSGTEKLELPITLIGDNNDELPSIFDANLTPVTVNKNDTYFVFVVADVTPHQDTRSIRIQVSDVAYDGGFEISTLTIDTAAASDGNVVVNLNGTDNNVAVTDMRDDTASEIKNAIDALTDYTAEVGGTGNEHIVAIIATVVGDQVDITFEAGQGVTATAATHNQGGIVEGFDFIEPAVEGKLLIEDDMKSLLKQD